MASAGDLDTTQVLEREVPWETYMTARLISDRDLQLIRRYDKKDPQTQEALLAEVCAQRSYVATHRS